MNRITSLTNPRVKSVVKLQEGRFRRESNRFLIDGFREIRRALQCGIDIREFYLWPDVFEKLPEPEIRNDFLRLASQNAAELIEVSGAVFEKIAFGKRREGILAVAVSRFLTWDDLHLPPEPLIGVVEQVEKPGNLGAIFRSADGAGLDAVLIADPLCDIYNPNTIRASLGTVFHVPAIVDTGETILRELLRRKITVAAARCDGAVSYTDFDWTGPTAMVLGAEADGLSKLWCREEIQSVRLPLHGIADSLNVSNAAAILFYEACRQRMFKKDR